MFPISPYFYVDAPIGFEINGRSTAISGANVTQDDPSNTTIVGNGSAYGVVNGSGFSQLYGFEHFGASTPSLGNWVSIKAYDYANDPNSVSGFTDATFRFDLVSTTAVPEPETYALCLPG